MKKLFVVLIACLLSVAAKATELAINDELTVVVTASSINAEVKAAAEDYHERLRANLKKYQYYPHMAIRQNYEGRVVLRLTIDNGKPSSEVLEAESNAHSSLQEAALKTMQRAVAATPLPDSLKYEFISVRYPFVFKLLDA